MTFSIGDKVWAEGRQVKLPRCLRSYGGIVLTGTTCPSKLLCRLYRHTYCIQAPTSLVLMLAPCVTEFQIAFLDAAVDCVKLQCFLPSTAKPKWLRSPWWPDCSKVLHIQQRFPAFTFISLHFYSCVCLYRWWKTSSLCNYSSLQEVAAAIKLFYKI